MVAIVTQRRVNTFVDMKICDVFLSYFASVTRPSEWVASVSPVLIENNEREEREHYVCMNVKDGS